MRTLSLPCLSSSLHTTHTFSSSSSSSFIFTCHKRFHFLTPCSSLRQTKKEQQHQLTNINTAPSGLKSDDDDDGDNKEGETGSDSDCLLGMLPRTRAYGSAGAFGRAIIQEESELNVLGELGPLATALAATYVTRLAKVSSCYPYQNERYGSVFSQQIYKSFLPALHPMPSTAAPIFGNHLERGTKFFLRTGTRNSRYNTLVARASGRPPPGVDTRIHWDNDDEGWVGGTKNTSKEEKPKNLFGENIADLLSSSSGSHYEFLGVSANADVEEIKVAYRRLSKEYHPDTTSLPLKTASEKFMRLREVYNVLSNEESRRFYDWTLAQEAASRQAEKMKINFEDPYEQEVKNWEPVGDMVDRLGGKNMKLSDQAVSAITIDIFIIIFAICCITYVIFFKEPY